MKILIFKGESSYDALRNMADRLASAFNSFVEAEVIDILQETTESLIKRLLRLDYNAIVSFNAVLTHGLTLPDANAKTPLLSMLPVPHVCWMMDDPIYHYDRLKIKNDFRLVLTCSEYHSDFLATLDSGAKHSVLFPGFLPPSAKLKPHRHREFDFIIAASWMGEPKEFWSQVSEPARRILKDTIDRVECGDYSNVYQAIKSAALDQDIDLAVNSNTLPLLIAVEDFLRQRERLKIIENIVNTDSRIGIIGNGWDDRGFGKNVRVFPSVNSSAILSHYQNSRIVVNLNARNGGSERLMDGISSGAAVLSPFSPSLSKEIPEGSGVRYLQYPFENNFNHVLEELSDTSITEELSQRGISELLESHLWSHRAKRMVDLFSNQKIQ